MNRGFLTPAFNKSSLSKLQKYKDFLELAKKNVVLFSHLNLIEISILMHCIIKIRVIFMKKNL